MSRRCVLSKDPTSEAARDLRNELIDSILDTLTEPEAIITAEFFGLSDRPVDCTKVCIQYGLTVPGRPRFWRVYSRSYVIPRGKASGVWETGYRLILSALRLLPTCSSALSCAFSATKSPSICATTASLPRRPTA